MDSSVDLDPIVFPYQDMGYKGVGGGKTGTKPKQKKGCKPSTTFAKPLTPVQSGVSASDSEGISSVKGEKEKEKPKRKATPSPSPVKGGAVGGKVKGNSCADGKSGGGPPSLGISTDSVAKLKAHIGGKGECSFVVVYYSVI